MTIGASVSECVPWGDREAAHGVANRSGMDRRFWDVLWFAWTNTHRCDGKIRFEGNMWRSENDAFIHIPYSVIDDFGVLVAVPWQWGCVALYFDRGFA